jgi:hypothetical protein
MIAAVTTKSKSIATLARQNLAAAIATMPHPAHR